MTSEINSTGDFLHLSPAERRKAKVRAKKRAEVLRRWKEARSHWTPKMFEEENAELERQKQAMLAERRAA
ncbi:hypothetical protein FIU85_01405 [Roseovarius sp. THAF8]|uniref:hypothetical protein n=1 Tax=Roseovarius sp. THAF8 TaxID=2587846 RepID=UPI00126863EC|nr:hypothetical protein [Roseovarius sp. THAF8]QFT95949.1 hypothetical protein FIU85_01405 [Roseovarius sp. THAF8]